MPSIQASIELYDSFSKKLNLVDNAMTVTMAVMSRLQSQMQTSINLQLHVGNVASDLQRIKELMAALGSNNPIQLSVNSEQVLAQLRTVRQQIASEFTGSVLDVRLNAGDIASQAGRIRQQIESIASTSVINLVMNAADVLTELAQIQHRISEISTTSTISVHLNAVDITAQAAQIRRQIDVELDGIVVRLRIELPASLEAMFGNLQQLVLRLIRATRQLRTRSADAADLRQALERIARLERQIADLQSRVNSRINEAGKNTTNWLGSLKGLVATYLSLTAAKGLLEMADDILSTNARLAMVNDGLRTQLQLQQQVMDAANETRANYQATADMVTKLGMSTQGIFKTDDDIIKFTKSFNKALVISGAGAQETTASILQMGQALGSGVLQGDELRSLSENAPALMTILAEGLGVARGQLKQLGSEGKLTSEMIVKAFEKQSDKIDAMFNKMPMTFGSATTILKNKTAEWIATLTGVDGPLTKITTLIQDFTAWLDTAEGEQFFSGLSTAITNAVDLVVWLGQVAAELYGYLSTNWPTLEPIVWGLVGALAAWNLATLAIGAASTFAAIGTGLMTAAVFIQTAATGGLRLAWAGLNATMKANIFILVATLIAGLIIWLVKLWQTNDKFAAGMMRAWNSVLNFFDTVPAYFWTMAEAILKAFKWQAETIGKIYDTVINGILDGINHVLDLINKVTGSSYEIAGTFNFANIADAALDYAGAKKDAAYADAATKAKEREAKVQNMLDNRASEREAEAAAAATKNTQIANAGKEVGMGFSAGSAAVPVVDKVKAVGKIDKPVDISKEDLKIMRDVAEMKNIQNFVTLKPTVQVKTGPVTNSANVDSIVSKITNKLNEEISSSAQGVYS